MDMKKTALKDFSINRLVEVFKDRFDIFANQSTKSL